MTGVGGELRRAGLLLTVTAAAVTGCTSGAGRTGASAAASDASAAASDAPSTGVPSSPAAASRPYQLLTHCGIDWAMIEGVPYRAEHPQVVEYGPPAGWDNPFQDGLLTPVSATVMMFRDDAGHVVRFTAEPGANPPLCD